MTNRDILCTWLITQVNLNKMSQLDAESFFSKFKQYAFVFARYLGIPKKSSFTPNKFAVIINNFEQVIHTHIYEYIRVITCASKCIYARVLVRVSVYMHEYLCE